jgi:predicted DNA-binding protein YlxM (UPF0122 family)
MFEKNLKFAYLLDFYGSVLDEHTEAVMKAYYDDDLSLAEVATGVGISRQGVRHIIKRGEEQLEFLEERLGLMAKSMALASAKDALADISSSLRADGDGKTADKIDMIIETIQ